jgi:hypothetical protein
MVAACAFWTMKITATARAAKPVISPVGSRWSGSAAVRAGAGPEPLAEGAAACWLCRAALPVRSWRYFLHKRDRIA